jgi:deoxyribose-phosphate aldolase
MNGAIDTHEAAAIALRCLDLTSLNDADTPADVERLCARARTAHGAVAAVCVWPRFAALARSRLGDDIAVAAVANFPAGGRDIDAALADVRAIVQAGAQEVDVVLPWRALLAGDDEACTNLLQAVRAACPRQRLKVILETGELLEPAVIARASRLALDAGADFLKTSTGKTSVGATLEAARVMLQAIAAHPQARDRAGLKLSGGLRRLADVRPYLDLVAAHWGATALQPQRLRFGASSLLADIEAVLGGGAASVQSEGY